MSSVGAAVERDADSRARRLRAEKRIVSYLLALVLFCGMVCEYARKELGEFKDLRRYLLWP